MSYSASVGLTAQLDQVLFPTPGPLHPSQVLSNLDHYRMYDAWLELHREGRTSIRLQTNFLHKQADPELLELKQHLRNQFQFFGDDKMMVGARVGGTPQRRCGLARSAAARRSGRLAQRERRGQPGRARAGRRRLRGGQRRR
jgi:hypothetical protein